MKLADLDREIIWHPYTHVNSAPKPLVIKAAEGSQLFTHDGDKLIDGISSWWVNLHGHCHPAIAKAIAKQAKNLDHTIFAGATHRPAVALAEALLKILPKNQRRVFYSDNGSTAVEVAMKMALQYWSNRGVKRQRIIALRGAYHGDTFGAMSVGERGIFTDAFSKHLFDVDFIDLPLGGARERSFAQMKELAATGEIAAFIFEPLVQGAGGMRIYEAKDLDKLVAIARENEIICIADEVMTGFGRTGKLFACNYLRNKPDIICVSKGITGGVLPLAATTCTKKVFKAFQSDDKTHTLYHGHSYTANPIACSAGLASMKLLLKKKTSKQIKMISSNHRQFAKSLAGHKAVEKVASLGTILSIELKSPGGTSYVSEVRDKIYTKFLKQGVFLRPLGNVVYVLPPYVTTRKQLKKIYKAIDKTLAELT